MELHEPAAETRREHRGKRHRSGEQGKGLRGALARQAIVDQGANEYRPARGRRALQRA